MRVVTVGQQFARQHKGKLSLENDLDCIADSSYSEALALYDQAVEQHPDQTIAIIANYGYANEVIELHHIPTKTKVLTEQDVTCPNCGHDNGWDFDICEKCGYGAVE